MGFKNNKGGYELRSKYFKGSSSPKYYTLIKGQNKTTINLFEGFFDFLSALTYYNLQIPNKDTIILISLTFISDVLPLFAKSQKVNTFLDNDKAGKNASIMLQNEFSVVRNRSIEIYPEFNDFNDFLKNKMAQQKVEPE